MKRTCLIPLLSVLLLAAVSCGGEAASPADINENTPSPADTAAATDAETEPQLYDAGDIQYDGYTFRAWSFDNEGVNGWTGIPNDIDVDAESGDLLNDSIFRRNKTVEDALNITIELSDSKTDTTDLRKSVMAGSNDCDAYFPREYDLVACVTGGLVLDMMSVDAFDGFSSPWWQKSSVDAMTIRGQLYSVGSDITYWDKLSTYVVFFNRQMVENYDLGDLYQLVADGGWTFDHMLAMGDIVSQDIDNNAVYDLNDVYGVSCQNDGAYIFLHAGGLTVCDRDSDGSIAFNLNKETHVNALQTIFGVMTDKKRYFNRQDFNADLNAAVNMFVENRALFLIRPIQSLFLMRDMAADFGILPLPKLYETQDGYHSAVNPYSATMLVLPKSLENPERSAVVTSYLASVSSASVIEPLYETVLGSKLIRDERSPAMLDLAFDGAVYDVGLIWNFGEFINPTLLTNRSMDIVSLVGKHQSKIDRAIAALDEIYSEAESLG